MNETTTIPPALVTGVTGQDGYYLARLLLGRGGEVWAGVLDPASGAARAAAAELPGLRLLPFDLLNAAQIEAGLALAQPGVIYHLAGISSVKQTWGNPAAALSVNAGGVVHMLEAMRRSGSRAHLVLAGSGDCFDHAAAGSGGIHPTSPLHCTNPYSISKLAAMKFIECYREQHGLRASTAILLNHTSPRRPTPFVERKIVHEAVAIARGRMARMVLGSLETRRDWSWAEDIVEGMRRLGEREEAGDYVFASGATHTTGDWVRIAFERLGLDTARHLEIQSAQLHRGDRPHTFGEIGPAKRDLGWEPATSFEAMVNRMIDAELGGA